MKYRAERGSLKNQYTEERHEADAHPFTIPTRQPLSFSVDPKETPFSSSQLHPQHAPCARHFQPAIFSLP